MDNKATVKLILEGWDKIPCPHCDAGACRACQSDVILSAITYAQRETWNAAAYELVASCGIAETETVRLRCLAMAEVFRHRAQENA